MENLTPTPIRSPAGLLWKTAGIATLLLFLILLFVLSVRNNRRLKRQILSLTDENDTLQELIDAGNAELVALKTGNASESPGNTSFQMPTGYRMPIINPGLKFNLQPDFSLPLPAFNAWNTGETLRVLTVMDTAGTFGAFRERHPEEAFPAWVFQLFTIGGALLQESHLPIAADQPDGKRIVAEIRALLESGIDETPNTETPIP